MNAVTRFDLSFRDYLSSRSELPTYASDEAQGYFYPFSRLSRVMDQLIHGSLHPAEVALIRSIKTLGLEIRAEEVGLVDQVRLDRFAPTETIEGHGRKIFASREDVNKVLEVMERYIARRRHLGAGPGDDWKVDPSHNVAMKVLEQLDQRIIDLTEVARRWGSDIA